MEVGEKSQDELQSIEEMEDNVLLCKVRTAHQMSITGLVEKTWGDEVDWRCDVCGRIRHDSYDPNGYLLNRWYEPMKGSKVVGEKLLANDFRQEYLRRIKSGEIGKSRPKKRHLEAVEDVV